jgi:hypothetical protein
MSVKIRQGIAQILGVDAESITERYGRYYLNIHAGKERTIVRKEIIFYQRTDETEEVAYARLVRDRVSLTPDLATVSTADLQAELSRREGVVTFVLDDEDSDFFYEYHDGGRVVEGAVTGPVTMTFKRD